MSHSAGQKWDPPLLTFQVFKISLIPSLPRISSLEEHLSTRVSYVSGGRSPFFLTPRQIRISSAPRDGSLFLCLRDRPFFLTLRKAEPPYPSTGRPISFIFREVDSIHDSRWIVIVFRLSLSSQHPLTLGAFMDAVSLLEQDSIQSSFKSRSIAPGKK